LPYLCCCCCRCLICTAALTTCTLLLAAALPSTSRLASAESWQATILLVTSLSCRQTSCTQTQIQ
jgi:hypothetical protein